VAKFPGVNHLQAVKALERAGFWIARQGKRVVMTDGTRIITVPRHNPFNAITMANIIRDAGLDPEDFKRLLGPIA
jgi:predicted RNA binding protein YcfA (HicA-like mRNA interferase family)